MPLHAIPTDQEVALIAELPVAAYVYKYTNASVPEGHIELAALGVEHVWSWKTVYGFWQRTPLSPAVFGVTLRRHLDDWICIGISSGPDITEEQQ